MKSGLPRFTVGPAAALLGIVQALVLMGSSLLASPAGALEVDATARVLAGLTTVPPAETKIVAATLQDFARTASARWADYERHIGEPMQKWGPLEKPRCRGIERVMSNCSAVSPNSRSSRFAAP